MRFRSFQSDSRGEAILRLASLQAYWMSDLSCAKKLRRAEMLL